MYESTVSKSYLNRWHHLIITIHLQINTFVNHSSFPCSVTWRPPYLWHLFLSTLFWNGEITWDIHSAMACKYNCRVRFSSSLSINIPLLSLVFNVHVIFSKFSRYGLISTLFWFVNFVNKELVICMAGHEFHELGICKRSKLQNNWIYEEKMYLHTMNIRSISWCSLVTNFQMIIIIHNLIQKRESILDVQDNWL